MHAPATTPSDQQIDKSISAPVDSHLSKLISNYAKKYGLRISSWTHQSCSWQDRTAKLQAPYSDDDQHKPLHQRRDSISWSNEGLHVVYLWYLLTYDNSMSNFYVMAGLMILLKRNTFNRCGMMVQCTSYISRCLVQTSNLQSAYNHPEHPNHHPMKGFGWRSNTYVYLPE